MFFAAIFQLLSFTYKSARSYSRTVRYLVSVVF
nr:MAG TPA: protein of unknown function (UPF0239) [Caudoviricetes sp.]